MGHSGWVKSLSLCALPYAKGLIFNHRRTAMANGYMGKILNVDLSRDTS